MKYILLLITSLSFGFVTGGNHMATLPKKEFQFKERNGLSEVVTLLVKHDGFRGKLTDLAEEINKLRDELRVPLVVAYPKQNVVVSMTKKDYLKFLEISEDSNTRVDRALSSGLTTEEKEEMEKE